MSTNTVPEDVIKDAKAAGLPIRSHIDGSNPKIWITKEGDYTHRILKFCQLRRHRERNEGDAVPDAWKVWGIDAAGKHYVYITVYTKDEAEAAQAWLDDRFAGTDELFTFPPPKAVEQALRKGLTMFSQLLHAGHSITEAGDATLAALIPKEPNKTDQAPAGIVKPGED